MASNFDFLKTEFPKMAEWGISAESKIYDAPVDALKDIGLMCEKMVVEICDHYEIEVDPRFGPAQARIDALKKEAVISSELAKTLHEIRVKRNKAVHDGEGTTEDCLALFPKAHEFAFWFADSFGNGNYYYEQYVIPDPIDSTKRDIYYVDSPTNEHDVEIAKLQENKDRRKTILKSIAWILGLSLAFSVLLAILIGVMAYREEQSSKNKTKEYMETIVEIEGIIEQGDYDKAEKRIEKLWPEPTVPIESSEDEAPAKLLASIEEKKAKANNTAIPTSSVPRSSKSLKGDSYIDVAREFQDAGFIRIYAKKADTDASVIHRKNTVMRISIDGESDFDEGDQYSKTVKIVIYYYY